MVNGVELRVGNAVYKRDKIIVLDISEYIRLWRMPLSYSPIPLTEEILLKCGFRHRSEHRGEGMIMDLKHDEKSFLVYKQYQKDGDGWGTGGTSSNVKIHYLHQLQNLIFALTNKEMEVKL